MKKSEAKELKIWLKSSSFSRWSFCQIL